MANSWTSKFKICLETDGVNGLRPLSELICADPSRVFYKTFTSVAGKNGVGQEVEMGFPVARWTWDWLPQTDIDTLQQFERQNVYIETETENGVTREFRIFVCYLQRLRLGEMNQQVAHDGRDDGLRQRRSVEAEFSQLVTV